MSSLIRQRNQLRNLFAISSIVALQVSNLALGSVPDGLENRENRTIDIPRRFPFLSRSYSSTVRLAWVRDYLVSVVRLPYRIDMSDIIVSMGNSSRLSSLALDPQSAVQLSGPPTLFLFHSTLLLGSLVSWWCATKFSG